MGGDGRTEPMTPVRIVVDDSAMSDAEVRRAARDAVRGIIGSGAFMLVCGAANSLIGALYLLFRGPWHFGWVYFGLGVMQMVMASSSDQLWRRPAIPTEFVVSEAGLTMALRGEASARTYPWKRVRTAINKNNCVIVIVGTTNLAMFQRVIAVPKPADAALCDVIWTALYAHMIAPRGLRATPADRLGVIRNTAFA